MATRNHKLSAMVSALFVFVFIGVGQVFKPYLSASRQGNLAAGCLGSLVFAFALTAISNLKMASFGANAKSGLMEISIALFIAVIASAYIHRISITLCILFSGVLLFFLNGISHKYYAHGGHSSTAHHHITEPSKKKK